MSRSSKKYVQCRASQIWKANCLTLLSTRHVSGIMWLQFLCFLLKYGMSLAFSVHVAKRQWEGLLEIKKLQMACDMPIFNDIMISKIGTILLLTHAVLKYE